jgi:hypothetical protein
MSQEPTLRLLLEDMCTSPDSYRNAWVINLHGELLPMPAIRNYSDAAKAPSRDLAGDTPLMNVRVVTHPEELRTNRSPSDPVRLRVYAYTTDIDYITNNAGFFGNPNKTKVMPPTMPIAIQVKDMNLIDPLTSRLYTDVLVEGITGGVLRDGTRVPYATAMAPIVERSAALNPNDEMNYEATYVDDVTGRYTLIKLYNTPVVAPWVADTLGGMSRGVPETERGRQYGLDYVPGSPGVTADFGRTLATPSASPDGPRNTARWRITIPGTAFTGNRFVNAGGVRYNPNADVCVTCKTRIWNEAWSSVQNNSTGLSFPTATYPTPREPDNLSETYTWWADAKEDVPFTERSQFLGDPRHNPYKDLLNGEPDDFANGYNWYHDSLNNNSEPAIDDFRDSGNTIGLNGSVLANRWLNRLRADVPRFFEVFRTALVNCGAVYTTLTGFSYYYVGFGNEIGSDAANGYPSSIPVSYMPYASGSGSWNYINTITWFRTLPCEGWMYWGGNRQWIATPWLGELHPDRVDTQWLATGNLPAVNPTTDFFSWQDEWVYDSSSYDAYGTRCMTSVQITASEGCTSFFNIGTATSTFHHHFWGGTSSLVGAGLDIGNRYNFPMPASAPSNRPFRIDTDFHGGLGSEWNHSPYSGAGRFSARLAKTYYNHPSGAAGSGLVELRNPANTQSAYIVVNGISNAVASGSSFIAKYSVLTMAHSFLEGTDPAMTRGINQLPRVEIEAPTEITEIVDPVTVAVRFGVTWRRWDGLAYTSATPVGFTQPESNLDYVVMYSRDNGLSWLIANRNTPATPGVRPTNPLDIVPDSGTGAETVGWSTPAGSFPQGTYLVRVECYRRGLPLHYAQHMVRIFINR